jgi:hypothetical protein
VHTSLEERVGHVNFAVVTMACAVTKNVVNEWQRVVVRHGIRVKFSVVVDPMRWRGGGGCLAGSVMQEASNDVVKG